MDDMCGRVIQASPPDQLGLKIIDALDPRDNRVTGDPFGNVPPRYNGAPSQQLWAIRQNPQTGEHSLDLLQWGLIPYWCKDKPKPPPINAHGDKGYDTDAIRRQVEATGAMPNIPSKAASLMARLRGWRARADGSALGSPRTAAVPGASGCPLH